MKSPTWPLVLLVVVLFVIFIGWRQSAADCAQRGGVLVRGAFWFECVAPR